MPPFLSLEMVNKKPSFPSPQGCGGRKYGEATRGQEERWGGREVGGGEMGRLRSGGGGEVGQYGGGEVGRWEVGRVGMCGGREVGRWGGEVARCGLRGGGEGNGNARGWERLSSNVKIATFGLQVKVG